MRIYDEMNKIAKLYITLPSNYELDDVNEVYEINPKWVDKVISGNYKVSDVIHDFNGILSKDEYFVPRIAH
jgi:hypothetical protein